MPTESEVKMARYNTVEREADEWGRVIGVRRLKPSEQTKISGLTPDLNGYDEMRNSDGEMVQIPHRLQMLVVAAVCEIDQHPIPFPRSRGELDAMLDRLDDVGIRAVGKAFARLAGNEPVADEAKNLSGIPSSA